MDKLMLTRRIANAATGTLLVAVSILLVLSGTRIPGLAFPYELDEKNYEFDMSFFAYMTMLIVGIACIANAMKLSRVPANTIVSFPLSRFIPGVILVALGLAGYVYYGAEVGHLNPQGTWMFLGGLSLFYPVSMLPLFYGSALLVFCAFSFAKIKFSRRGDVLCIDEMRFPRAMSTEIPVKDINVATLSNTRTGIKHLWILPFIIPVVFLYIDGFSFLLNPSTFGEGFIVGYVYLLSASVQLFCMVFILINGQHVLLVATANRLHELHFYPVNLDSILRTRLSFVLGLPDRQEYTSPPVHVRQPTDFKRLACGAAFIIAGISGRAFYFGAGEIMRFVLLVAGIILVVEAVKNDLKLGTGTMTVQAMHDGNFLLSGKGIAFKTEHYFHGVRQLDTVTTETFEDATATIQLRKLSAVDHVVATVVAFVAGFHAWPLLALVPAHLVATFSTPRIALLAGLLVLLALVLLAPSRVMKVKLGDRNVQVPAKMQFTGTSWFTSLVVNLLYKYRIAWTAQRMQLVLRLVEIALAFTTGLVASAVLFFA